MAATTRTRSKTMVQRQSIDQASALLQQLPEKPKENMSLREAVDQLRDQLQAALAKGYSYEDLTKMLANSGIDISATTLKSYVPTGKRQANKDKDKAAPTGAKRGRKRGGATSDDSLESSAPPEPTSPAPEAEETSARRPGRKRASSSAAPKGTPGRRASTAKAPSGNGRRKRGS